MLLKVSWNGMLRSSSARPSPKASGKTTAPTTQNAVLPSASEKYGTANSRW